MVGEKKNTRLFQAAKELNVSTSVLVEHLAKHDQSVEDSPNTKLSSEQYSLLLKAFASEKMLKAQAEQLSEKRREDFKTASGKGTEEASGTATEEVDTDKDPLSANQIRDRIGGSGIIRRVKPLPGPESTEKEVASAPSVPAAPEPVAETPQQEASAPAPESRPAHPPLNFTPSAPEDTGGLKVVGKIDLDALKNRPSRPDNRRQEPSRGQGNNQGQGKNQGGKPGSNQQAPQSGNKPNPGPRQGDLRNSPRPAAPNRPEPSKAEDTGNDLRKPPIQPEPPAGDDSNVITVSDNTPKLSGLTIKGRIDLTPNRPKKDTAKPAAPASTGGNDGDDEGEETDASGKKRRRRRRKRKGGAQAGTTPAAGEQTGTTSAKPGVKRTLTPANKKEKPTAGEVDKTIRDTLSQMGKGASRSRQRLRRAKRDSDAVRRENEAALAAEGDLVLNVTEFISANEFANLLDVHVNDVIRKSFELGMMVSINQRLDAELMTILAEEYGYEINFVDVTEDDFEIDEEDEDPALLSTRTPIVTVMGHVDHGKTTLLDKLRKANVAAGEAGGITQHIGAYEVKVGDNQTVTFLDTPGHEAFTAMRARGAKVTDVAIIVIAADDAVMPQTKEAINHAEAAGVPMVFALNKIDKPGADPERIKTQLASMNYLVEEWGGKYQSQEISALKGIGVDELLEKVILESELLDLKANPDRSASGTVIEARLDKGRGNVATVLVQNGTLRVGDEVVAGIHYGKVRALIDQKGQRIKEAGPAKPVQLLGLGGSPQAGDKFLVFTEDGRAKELAQRRQEVFREQQFRQTKRITLEEIGRRRAIGNFKELNVIIRGDVDGSVEALSGALMKLSTNEVQVNIIAKGNGAITEADVNLAIASDAVVIAFNVRPNALARTLAEREEVDVRTYSVIYDAINDVRDALEGLLSPEIKEEEMGTAEVLEVFRITKVGTVAGGLVKSGKIKREDPVRVIRDGIVIYTSKLGSLKRFKDDAKEVFSGQEFGFTVDNYPDLKQGDIIESFHVNEIKRRL